MAGIRGALATRRGPVLLAYARYHSDRRGIIRPPVGTTGKVRSSHWFMDFAVAILETFTWPIEAVAPGTPCF